MTDNDEQTAQTLCESHFQDKRVWNLMGPTWRTRLTDLVRTGVPTEQIWASKWRLNNDTI